MNKTELIAAVAEASGKSKADVKDADFGSDPEFIDYAKVYEARRPILEKAVKAILADKKEAKK